MFKIIIQLLHVVLGSQVVYFYDADGLNPSTSEWIANSAYHDFTICNGTRILGGYGVYDLSSSVMKYFSLPAHTYLQIDIQFYRIDGWDYDYFDIFVDDQYQYDGLFWNLSGIQRCGASYNDEIISISIRFRHESNFALIQLKTLDLMYPSPYAYWGFSRFKLSVDTCPFSCAYCQEYEIFCRQWVLLFQDHSYNYFATYVYVTQSMIMSYSFQLPPHDLIMIRFRFLVYADMYIELFIDNTLVKSTLFEKNPLFNVLSEFTLKSYPHKKESINIAIQRAGQVDYLYLKDFQIFVSKLQSKEEIKYLPAISGCSNYINQICWECKSGWIIDPTLSKCLSICGDGLVVGNEQCDDGNNSNQNGGCSQCQFQCQMSCQKCISGVCSSCIQGYFLDGKKKCTPKIEQTQLVVLYQNIGYCEIGWIYDELYQYCIPQCGDSLIVGNEECDDGNVGQNMECYSCKYECPLNCLKCKFGICQSCKDDFFLDGNKQCQPKQENDLTAIMLEIKIDKFTELCDVGWIFNKMKRQCEPLCGDSIIVGNEQCDDGNDIQLDGCYECQFQCGGNCNSCKFGICQSCQNGFYLNQTMTCQTFCGDGVVTPYQEECDDSNGDQGDGCYNCLGECINCSECFHGICFSCATGYKLDNNKICIPDCGDLIVISEYEECDDGNNQKYDGCYECKYQCYNNCNICDKGICLDVCPYGEVMVNHKCEQICGNKIITEKEECDDGNIQQFDGCYQCLFSCPQFCQYCERGVCLECQEEYLLQNSICIKYEVCGNGQIGEQEDCDDGNVLPSDGCFNCKIEQNWICVGTSFSDCTFQITPTMVISYLNSTSSFQYVKMYFSEEIKIASEFPLSQTMQVSLLNVPEQNQNITIYPIYEATTNLSQVEYVISIQVQQSMTEKPVLGVNLYQQVYNNQNVSVQNSKQTISLNIPEYLNPNLKQSAQQLLQLNKNIMVGLGFICVFTLIFGEASIFQEILNILQYQSYLKYINLQYPENLVIFFQASDLVSISPLLEFVHVDSYIKQISLKEQPLGSNGKFQFYQQDADLLTNLSCQIFQFAGLISIYVSLKLFQILLFNNLFISKYFYCMSRLASRTNYFSVLKFNKGISVIIRGFFKLSQLMAWQGFRRLLLLNSWDLIFKIFLYLYSMKLNSMRDSIQMSVSILVVLSYFIIIFESMNQNGSIVKRNKIEQYQAQLEVLTLCRQMAFLGLLVFMQSDQIMQTISISLVNISYFCILTKSKEMNNKIISCLIEGTIIVFTMTSVVYFDSFDLFISSERRIMMAFLHIGILCFSLIAEIVKFAVSTGTIFIEQIKLKLKKCAQKDYPRAPVNPFSVEF